MRAPRDADQRAMRRASRVVGLQITIAASALVVGVVVAAFAFVLHHIKADRLLSRHEATIDIGGLDIIRGAIVIGVVAIVVAAVLSWFTTRRAVRPLGEALRSRRAFVADASHELRTPLAVLDARLQSLQRRLDASDPSAATVDELRRDTAGLVRIVNDLLEVAEDGPGEEGPVRLGPAVELAVDSMRVLADDRGIALDVRLVHDVEVDMPTAAIHRCVVALVDNALKYSPDRSRIEVAVRLEGSSALLTVLDQGSGITGIEPSAIFDRFARGAQASHDADRAGFGIGLSLVRDSVERAGGTVGVVRTGPQGTEIAIRLPRAGAARRRERAAARRL